MRGAFDQAADLLARVAADALDKAQHHGFVSAPEPAVAEEAAHGACDEVVALGTRHRKIHGYCAIQKGL